MRKDYSILTYPALNTTFAMLCRKGDLKEIKYLLTSKKLKVHADINYNDSSALIGACLMGRFKVVKYLLTSPDLKEHAVINARNDNAIRCACYNGHYEIVKYLLTSPDLKEHSNINALDNDNHNVFTIACKGEHLEIIKFLIFDFNIEKTEHIKDYLSTHNNKKIEMMFELRELKNKLEKDLTSDKLNNKKTKI